MRQRQPRERYEKHCKFIRTLPCLVCLDNTATEAAHIRFGDRRVAKVSPGIAAKPSDCWTVPLCSSCHRTGPEAQHKIGEEKFWSQVKGRGKVKDGPIFVAMALFINSGDHSAGEQIIREQH